MSHVDEGTLHAFLDGELSSSERAGVDAHVAQCAACRARLAEERALLERASALLGSARPIERPAPAVVCPHAGGVGGVNRARTGRGICAARLGIEAGRARR